MAKKDWSAKTSEAAEPVRRQWRADRALRPPMRSPGRPESSRQVQRQFWRLVARGINSAEAAVLVGVSVPVGSRGVYVSVSWPRDDGRSWPHLQLAGVLVTV